MITDTHTNKWGSIGKPQLPASLGFGNTNSNLIQFYTSIIRCIRFKINNDILVIYLRKKKVIIFLVFRV